PVLWQFSAFAADQICLRLLACQRQPVRLYGCRQAGLEADRLAENVQPVWPAKRSAHFAEYPELHRQGCSGPPDLWRRRGEWHQDQARRVYDLKDSGKARAGAAVPEICDL